jgi:SAM-dependent methyltransferase
MLPPPHDVPPLEDGWLDLLDAVAPRCLGPGDRRGAALAADLRRTSELYRERESLATIQPAARLRFFLPRDLPKVEGPLSELLRADALPRGRVWRVLDLGAGEGATSLGVARFAARHGVADRLAVTAVDRSAGALDAFASLADGLSPSLAAPVSLTVRVLDYGRGLAGLPDADLVLMGLSVNELVEGAADPVEATVELLDAALRKVRPGGSLIVLEPATRGATRRLMAARDRLAPRVFAPCLRAGPCPLLERPRDWCHARLQLGLPERLGTLAEAAGLRRAGLTYAYLTLRRDGRRLADVAPGALRVVGGPVVSKGKTEWEGCSEAGRVRLRRLDRERSADNAALDDAGRGALIVLEGVAQGASVRLRPGIRVSRP